jgi:phosphoenolpyruvate carboxykinase (diphosphate)
LQSLEDFVDGLDNIIETQRRVALNYFEDGSIDAACPPLKALLHVMAYGNFEGKPITDPAIRALFTRESLISSSWYQARLDAKAGVDIALWTRHLAYLQSFLNKPNSQSELKRLKVQARIEKAQATLAHVSSAAYRTSLIGMLGTDPELV